LFSPCDCISSSLSLWLPFVIFHFTNIAASVTYPLSLHDALPILEEGYIISQSPEADSEVEIGSELSVDVSLGPEEQPPKAHKVTFTVPFKPDEKDDDDEDSEDSDDEDSEDDKADDKENTEQKDQIYVDYMNEEFSEVFEEDGITEDQEYELTLAIEEGKTAKYKVVRDVEVILERKVAYGEGE